MKRILSALVLVAATVLPAAAHAQVGFAVRVGPAAVYATPCPGPGYIWTPGYYAGTIWVPGRWAYRAYYHPYYAHPYYHAYDSHHFGRR
jgi:hypothetical protein